MPNAILCMRRRRLPAAVLLAVVLIAVVAVPPPASAAVRPRVFHITPDGGGARDGSSQRDAAVLATLPRLIAAADPGDEVWIHGGRYHIREALVVTSGGDRTAPVVVRGVPGTTRRVPHLVGSRSDPYAPEGNPGVELFKLLGGADHLRFEDMAFENQGNGVFRIGADITDLTIRRMFADNVHRFVENYRSGDARSATVDGLRIEDVEVRGFSKSAIRLRYDTQDVVIRDVYGDSERQDGDNFAMGVHLDDTVHDVRLERVTMRNSHDSRGPGEYWNGDGFVTERGTHHISFRDTLATGSTDGGYDLKSTATTLVRARARGNKRNIRIWGDATVFGCTAAEPRNRGGTGGRANVWVGSGAHLKLIGCALSDASSRSRLLTVEEGGRVTVVGDARARRGDMQLERGAVLDERALVDEACADNPARSFRDIAASGHRDAIACIADRGIASGIGGRRFAPARSVTRGQMATFAAGLVEQAGRQLPDAGDVAFTDVAGSVHATSVRRLAAAGLVEGFADGTYRPNQPISRAQAASLVDRAYAFATGAALPDAGFDAFDDDDRSVHEPAVNRLAGVGIARGGRSGQFKVSRDVRRDEMATLLARALGVSALPPLSS